MLNYLRILLFLFLISRAYGELKFNNLQEKLVLQLLKVKPSTNLVASPLLLRFPLCKLASVATGDAKQELMTVLGYKDESIIGTCYSKIKETLRLLAESDLTYVNRIYVNYTDDINPNFMANSTEKFGVQVEKIGFNYPKAAVSYVNRWIGTGTYKRITDILDYKDINKETTMIIVNAVHFKGTWEFPFNFRLTKLMKFSHIDGKISRVPMMTKTDSFMYAAGGDCTLLSIKFGSWRTTITFIVPNSAQGLPKLLDKMQADPQYIPDLMKNMKWTPLKINIPRFKIKTYVDWTGFLQDLGLYSIFDKKKSGLQAVLRKTSKNKNIALNKAKQKTFIQIDELGVARFTVDPMMKQGDPPKVPVFLGVPTFDADKPFFFQITLDFENDRYDLFDGVYYGPEPSAGII